MREKEYFVYILASRPHGAIYVGMTSDLAGRIAEHQSGEVRGHTQKYDIKMLVYYELFYDVNEAIIFEKQLKKWRRAWKDALIEKITQNGKIWPMRFFNETPSFLEVPDICCANSGMTGSRDFNLNYLSSRNRVAISGTPRR